MHDVYIYDKGQDYDSLGLVGALTASSCVYDANAGEAGEIALEHPFDDLGKWSFLQEGRILKAWVPVRVTPLINISPTTQTITREIYKVKTNGGRLRLRQKPNTSAKVLARYNPGAEVVKLEEAGKANGHTWYKVSSVKDGQTGYMAATYLTYVRSYTETVGTSGSVQLPESTDEAGLTNWTVRPQLFEIYRKAGNGEGRTVYARHISYKLLKNATTYEPDGAVTLQDTLNGILGNCRIGHDFHAYTDIGETRSDVSWHEVNPIKALLDAETGAAAKWGAQVVFDNWDMFFLKRAGRNRGMRIEYGKNLVGVESNEDISNTATRIMPIGKKKDGTDLLLPELYIDSVNISRYAEPMLYTLECSDCKVGDKMTEDQAFAEMRKRAQDMLDGGCDQPEVSLKVDFVSLGDSEEYAQFREMDKLFMYDEVEVVSERGYADAKAQVVSMSWDCLHDRVLELGVGSIGASLTGGKLASWQIPSGISGGKIAYGSVGSAQLGQDVVSARHMQAESVSAEAIQAGVVTAEKIAAGAITADKLAAGSITADKITSGSITSDKISSGAITTDKLSAGTITADKLDANTVSGAFAKFWAAEIGKLTADSIKTDELYAAFAHVFALAAGSITAGNITADKLSAELAKFVSMYAKTGEFDFATIKNLVAQAMALEQGSMDTVYIKNLAVTSANMLSATLGKLILKGNDGKYYQVFVGADGTISTEVVYVTGDEIADGQTGTGKQIIETTMNVGSLNATNLQANSAVINQILTTALTAEKITAADALIASATIPELYVTTIRAIGESLELVNGRTNVIHRGETPPADAGEGDLWVQPGTGALFQAAAGDQIPEFYLDGEGVLYYRYGEGQTVYALTLDENGDLYADGAAPFAMAIGPDGEIIAWARVKDAEIQAGIDKNKGAIDENKEAIDGANKLIREQSAKITEMADAIDLRVTTKVYEEGLEGLGALIQKNEASITLLDQSITSKVSQEVYDEDTGAIREEVSQIKQTADNIRLEVKKKTAVFRQEAMPDSYVKGDLWIKPSDGTMKIADEVGGALMWRALKPSELNTSYIDIAQDHIDISTGGSLNVDSGAAHFRTGEYTLSILADDGSEDTVMDFDADSRTLRVTKVAADNLRPFVRGVTEVTSAQVGGIEGLRGMLEGAQYEHLIYRQTAPDYSADTVVISGVNSIMVEIVADALTQIPPLEFSGVTGNIHLKNMKWSVAGENSSYAVAADSGSIMLRDCYIDGVLGIGASGHARMIWIGYGQAADSPMTTAGACNYAATANEGGDIVMCGLIPAGDTRELFGGTVRLIDTVAGAGGAVSANRTETVNASVGYYGTRNGWNGGKLYQGYSNGKGRIYGCMRFEIPDDVQTVKSAVLSLHRYKGAGKGSEVDVIIRGSATAFGQQPDLGVTVYASREDAVLGGAAASFDVTNAAQALANGTIRQLVLYTGESKTMSGKDYSSQYALFDSAVLKITY